MSRAEIKVFRHTDHVGNIFGTGLIEGGIEEARQIGKAIESSQDVLWHAYSPNTKRHLGTVVLAMFPDKPTEDVRETAEYLVLSGRITINDELTYEPIKKIPFTHAMNVAINERRAMGFFLNDSDVFLTDRDDLKTYSVMASTLAKTVLPIESDSLICAREYIIPSFRAKLMQVTLGNMAAKEYANWYNENQQGNPLARVHVMNISKDGEDYSLQDEYGTL